LKVGDRVGVGAQSESCLGRKGPCEACSSGRENYCHLHVGTYNSVHINGGKSYGGYARYKRAPSHFVVKIPDRLSSAEAAPMLCGGVTTYAPLKYHGAGPGKTVGVVGLGGLGHFAVLWAKALKADRVVVISRSSAKREDALRLGADDFIAYAEDPNWTTKHASTLDIIINTVSANVPLKDLFSVLRFDGTLVQVGAPEDPLPSIPLFPLLFKRIKITGSIIGSPNDIREMLQLAADQNIKPWIQEIPMKDANQAILDLAKGKPRYRYVLVNEPEEESKMKAGL
jgi:alcohol dehydrogenase (NADP+)